MTTRNLESLTIHRFRGLRDLELKDLGQINLLVGINNSGKTSVLEALNIYCHPLDVKIWLSTARMREQDIRQASNPTLDALQWLFPQDPVIMKGKFQRGNIHIVSEGSFDVNAMQASYKLMEEVGLPEPQNNSSSDRNVSTWVDEESSIARRGLELEVKFWTKELSTTENLPDFQELRLFHLWEGGVWSSRHGDQPSLGTSVVTPYSHRSELSQLRLLSEAKFQNFKPHVLSLLQQLDKNIVDLEILLSPEITSSRFNIYIQHKKLGLAPISTFGDGVRRLLHIALKLASVRGGVLLIDELEATIHTEALQSSFSWLAKWCKDLNVQLFATTHSLETVDTLLEVTEAASDLVLYRLEPKEAQTRVVRHDWNRLKRLREEMGQEVRW